MFFSIQSKTKTGDYLIKKRAVEAWKNKRVNQLRPFAKSLMARKMHCTLQEIGNDSPKVSEAGKDSISTIHQQQNTITPFKDCGESSVSSINPDSGCAILTYLNFEPDGNWRIVAEPVRCLNHINLVSIVHMDGLQLLFSPPVNRLKIDQRKGPRGPLPHCAYSVKSFMRRNIAGSNVRRRCQNKIAKKASKLNELNEVPGNSCSQSSLICNSGLFPDSSAAVNSSDKFTSNSKEDKSLKKNSRKRARKKVRKSKKNKSDNGSTEREAPNEEYVCVSLTSETSSSNDVDKEAGVMLYTTEPELCSSDDRLVKDDCERNGIKNSINVTEAPKSCNSCIDKVEMSKAIAPVVQDSAGESATFDSKNQLQDSGPDSSVTDTEAKDIQHVDRSCYNDVPDSLVLDSVSVGSNSDASTKAGDIGKRSNKVSRRITSKSGDGYFLGQNVSTGMRNNCEHNEGIVNGGQNCITNDKGAKQKRTVSKSSSFNKFGSVGIMHNRTGKENSHSIWQKVQKNGSDECNGNLKKVNTTLSQFGSTVKKDPSIIRNSSSASVNVLSKTEDKKHLKNKVGRKSKVRMESASKKGHCSYSRKNSHLNAKACVQQNDMPHVSSQENNQQGLTSVSGFNSDVSCLTDGFETDRVEQIISELVHSSQFHLGETDSQENVYRNIASGKNENMDIQDSSSVMPSENSILSNMSEEQCPASCSLLGDETVQPEKEVSYADHNAQNHSSGTSLWKWIPIGKKDTGLAKSDSSSSSPEYSDAPLSKYFSLESNVDPKVDSFPLNQDSSLNASRTCMVQVDKKISCLDEGENQSLGNQVACTVTEHRVKNEAANQMIQVCENQDTSENDSYRLAQAVSDACRAQLACEAVHMATGGPIAEIERLLHFCSPVIYQSPNSQRCFTCSPNHGGCVALCRHEIPDLSLGDLWQWYEKHGSYGLEIRAQDFENPKRLGGVGHFPFRAYFVPSLSAVQLFKNHTNQCVNSSDKFLDFKDSEACEMIDISEHSSSGSPHPIFSVLFPQPRNQDTNIQTQRKTVSINNASDPFISSKCSGDLELLYEYFEVEQPQQRQPLYEKIQELVGGDMPVLSKSFGDPTTLESINLRDLHPGSWYSVAWYPIYRIPDSNFRAAFLTYHSLGHLVRRSTNSDSPTVGSCIVSPAVGLQSYNAQGECWFQQRQSALAAEMLGLNPTLLLKERLHTLEETASLMAKAVVNKGNQICTNRHPDYEFFLSRRRY